MERIVRRAIRWFVTFFESNPKGYFSIMKSSIEGGGGGKGKKTPKRVDQFTSSLLHRGVKDELIQQLSNFLSNGWF